MGAIESHKIYGLKIRESANDGSDFSNPEADYRLVFLGEDGVWHARDSAGTVTTIGGSGIAATLFDAKGDIIAASAADTAARLAVGSNGQVLSADSAEATGLKWITPTGIPAGTSFPGSPATDDLFNRTDRDIIYRYDGTRWLSAEMMEMFPGWVDTAAPLSGTNTLARYVVRQDYGIYLVRWNVVTFQTNGTPASNNMSVALTRLTGANAATDLVTFTTNADTASNWVNHDQAINAVLDSSARSLRTVATETGTVTGFICAQSISYRLIG